MATGDSNSRKDIAWKYAYLANQNNKSDLTCNFCGKVAKWGAYRLKQHLVGGYKAIVGCQKCPEHVKEEVNQYMLRKKNRKIASKFDGWIWWCGFWWRKGGWGC